MNIAERVRGSQDKDEMLERAIYIIMAISGEDCPDAIFDMLKE